MTFVEEPPAFALFAGVVLFVGLVLFSLMRSIECGRPSPTKGDEDSTASLDVEHVPLGGAWVTLFDCAGQVITCV